MKGVWYGFFTSFLQDALDALVKTTKATTLIVAHRLSTIQNADLIIVLEPSATHGATVVQQGTHHELMKDTVGRTQIGGWIGRPVNRTTQHYAEGCSGLLHTKSGRFFWQCRLYIITQ